jgi:hypothetical protein
VYLYEQSHLGEGVLQHYERQTWLRLADPRR